MYNLNTNFRKLLEICKYFSKNIVNQQGNIPHRGAIPRFPDIEIIALSY